VRSHPKGAEVVKNPPNSGFSDRQRAFRTGFADRLRVVLDSYETRLEAAAVAGVGANQLARYLRGGADPTWDVISHLALNKGVSLNWLATGLGPRSASDDVASFEAPGMVSVPMYDFRAGAGSGEIAESEEPIARIALHRDLLVAHGISPKSPGLTMIGGYSMRPTIDDGDLAVFDRTDREPRDKIYLFRRSGALLVKELRRRSDGTLTLISHNPSYEPEELPRDEADTLEIIGRVGMVLKSV
jgi:phage repressor protein C with HTH and peptisase S24 domain